VLDAGVEAGRGVGADPDQLHAAAAGDRAGVGAVRRGDQPLDGDRRAGDLRRERVHRASRGDVVAEGGDDGASGGGQAGGVALKAPLIRPFGAPSPRTRGEGRALRLRLAPPLIRPFGAPSPRARGEGNPQRLPSPRWRGEGGAKRRMRGSFNIQPVWKTREYIPTVHAMAAVQPARMSLG